MQRWRARRLCVAARRGVHAETRSISTVAVDSNADQIAHAFDEPGRARPPTSPTSSGPSTRAFESRCLLRSLLRQSTYLPDEFARSWVKQHIVDSFQTYKSKAHNIQSDSSTDERFRKKLTDGRRALSQLQRAAEGDSKCLQKVLMSAYGRIGKRRRELLRRLLPSPSAEDDAYTMEEAEAAGIQEMSSANANEVSQKANHEALKGTSLVGNTSSTKRTKFEPQPLEPRLAILLESQMRSGPPTLTRPNPRRLHPDIPELNTWMRPMPQKRVKNMHKKFYAELIDRALPPLPQHEWERLRDFASGKREPEPPRRQRRQDRSADGGLGAGMSALDIVVRYGKVPRPVMRSPDDGQKSPRSMQRLYAKVFSQCPLMQYNEDKQKWDVTWGEQGLLGQWRGVG